MRVMLDYDLAELYQVETKKMKQAVRRNIKRFPSDFMFEITENEYRNIQNICLRSQNATPSWGGLRYMPFAFTQLCKCLHTLLVDINPMLRPQD